MQELSQKLESIKLQVEELKKIKPFKKPLSVEFMANNPSGCFSGWHDDRIANGTKGQS